MTNIFTTPSQETKNKITLWLNHLLVLYSFLIPIHNGAKSSMFFTMLVLFLYRRDYVNYLKGAFSNKIVQAFLLFYLMGALGMLYTDNIDYGKDHMDKIKYLLFPLFFLSFLDVRFVFRIIFAFILGMFFAELFSYLIHFNFLPYEFVLGKYELWETRAYSPAPFIAHSDHGVGISIAVGVLLYYILNFKNESISRKVTAFFLLIIAILNITFIASRTGYMTFISVLFIVIILSYKKNLKLLISSILVFFLACFLLYSFSDTINKRINGSITNFRDVIKSEKYFENRSTGQRIGLTIYGMEVAKDHLLFGTGTGDFMDLLREKIPEEQKKLKTIAKPHNVYVQIVMQHGIIGVILFLYLIYSICSYKNIIQEKKDIMIIITIASLVFMLGGMLYGTFELPLIIVFITAMIVNKQQNIIVDKFDKKLLLKYFIFVIFFLIIGVTR